MKNYKKKKFCQNTSELLNHCLYCFKFMSEVELNSGDIYYMRSDQMFKIKNILKQTDPIKANYTISLF